MFFRIPPKSTFLSLCMASESLFLCNRIDHCCTWLARANLSIHLRIECFQRIFSFWQNQERLFTNHRFIQSFILTNCAIIPALNHVIPFRQQVSLFAPEEGQVIAKCLQNNIQTQRHYNISLPSPPPVPVSLASPSHSTRSHLLST